jgi:hypothetical protein
MSQFKLNGCASLKCDPGYYTIDNKQSIGSGIYQLSRSNDINNHLDYIDAAIDNPTTNYSNGFGVSQSLVNEELREGRVEVHKRDTNQLFTRPFLTVPYIGKGEHNVDAESDLLSGENTKQHKQCNALAGVFLQNQFTPLIPHLKENIQNVNNLITENIKTDWIRGGIDTSQITKDIDYFEKCNNDPNVNEILINKKGYLKSVPTL